MVLEMPVAAARERALNWVLPGELGLQRPVDHHRHHDVLIDARPSRAEHVMQPFHAQLPIALAPLAVRHLAQPHLVGAGRVGFASTAGKQDVGALHDRMRQ